jgi:hypothetical protein
MRRWQLPPDDPWAPYAKYTLAAALDSQQRTELPEVTWHSDVQRASRVGRELGAGGTPSDTLFVVDLRGAASVAFGVALSRASSGAVSVVPTFNNWPNEKGLVPAEETLAAMVSMSPRPRDSRAPLTTPVFLLGSWRLAYRSDDPGDGTHDNRYILTPNDLPDATALRARGIQRVLYVVGDLADTASEEDDLHARFRGWDRAGIPIAIVDLPWLDRPIGAAEWPAIFERAQLSMQPRATVVDDLDFYGRARGGFGGEAARASSIRIGGVWFPSLGELAGYDGAEDVEDLWWSGGG